LEARLFSGGRSSVTIVFLLEEPSMREALEGLLPRVLLTESWRFVVHEGKQDLEKSIPRKLKAWREPDVRFVVIRDQDSSDCQAVKERLQSLCTDGGHGETLIRIACRELESWFLGDLNAVEAGLGAANIAHLQQKRKYRDPDNLGNPHEELRKLVKRYQQISGARAIGPYLNPETNRSRSFQVLVEGLRRLAEVQ
jgi:hypothetical protein